MRPPFLRAALRRAVPARWLRPLGRHRAATTVAAGVAVAAAVAAAVPHDAPPGVILQGAEFGAVNGLLALGLVLTYRANRVINFSYGAMGSVAGTVAVMAYLGHHVNWFACLALGAALGGVLGAAVDLLVMRRFFHAPRLVVMVATIGLAQVLGGIQLFVPGWLHGPPLVGGFTTPLSSAHMVIHPVVFDGDDLLVALVVPVAVAALGWFLLRTDAGVAVRSVADNADRAQLLGIPVRRLSTLVWAIAGVLAAVTVMVSAPSQGLTLSAAAGPTLLLPALAAAVIARMERLPLAFGSAVALGVVNAVVAFNVRQEAVTDVVFLAAILVALLLQRRPAGRAADAGETWLASGVLKPIPAALRRLPEVVAGRAVVGLVVAVVLVLIPLRAGPGITLEYTVALVFGLAALSLVVLSGWSGSISLGQFAFAGVGGVVAGDLVQRANVDLFLCLAAAAAAGGLLAVAVGLPALRIRGDFLAVTTLALAVAVNSYFLNPTNFTADIPQSFLRPVLWGRFDLQGGRPYYFLCLGLLVAGVLFVKGLRGARAGRVLLATRDNPKAASAMAVPTVRVKLTGFVLAGAIAGIAGALYATALRAVGQDTFDPSLSLLVFAMAVIGGMGSISGALLGVAAIQVATYGLPQYQQLIAGTGLLLILLVLPGGLGAALETVRNRLLRVVAERRRLLVPSLVADRRSEEPTHAPREAALLSHALGGSDPPPGVGARPPDRVEDVLAGRGGLAAGAPAPAGASAPAAVADLGPDAPTAPVPVAARAGPVALSCRGVEVSYGPVQILFGVDMEVHRGEIVALLGTNGAGKSTLLKAVSGLARVGGGSVLLGGTEVTGTAPDAMARRRVALMPGGRGVFATLTVDENLRLGAWLVRRDRRAVTEGRRRVLALFPVLAQRRHQAAGDLSGGEQQMLSLAMALMVPPDVLMIDELSLGLAPTVVAQLIEVVRTLNAAGTTVVVVEQSVNVALELAGRALFLEKGEVRFSGRTADLLERPDVLRSVFIAGTSGQGPGGERAGAPDRQPPPADAPAVLECRQVTKRFGGITAANAVDLVLREGEILGLIGHNGAGKTTLMDLVSGFLALDGGRVLLGGMDVGGWPAHVRAAAGLGRTFQEARLFPSLTVVETVAVALERHLASKDLVAAGLRLPASSDSEAEAQAKVDELVALMGLGAFAEKLVGELSTGTRRIVELACVLAQDPAVLLLDEPSGGVAQRETEAMGPLLERVQQYSGCAILVIEHDMPLLSSICDRMVALELGEVIAEGRPAEVLEHPRVVESYLGTDQSTIRRSGARVGV